MFQPQPYPFPGDQSEMAPPFPSSAEMGGVGSQFGMPQYGMGPPQMQQDPQGRLQLSRINLNPVEVPCFQQLWMIANPQGLPALPGSQAAEFLRLSGLPQPLLHQLWTIADMNNEGMLGFEEFCVACRLVAHAQNGMNVAPEMIDEEPFTIPHFDIAHQHSSLSDASSLMGGGVPLGSSMNPNAAANFASPGMSPSHFTSTSSTPGQDNPFIVTEQQRTKYFGILQTVAVDADGYLPGEAAKTVMSRSGLSDNDLSQIWMLADQDADGRLSPAEFVVAMHLISVCRKGAPVPQVLPMEFQPVLMGGPLPQQLELPTPADSWGAPPADGFGSPLGADFDGKGDDLFGFDSNSNSKDKKKKKKKDDLSFGDLVETEQSKLDDTDDDKQRFRSRRSARRSEDQEESSRVFEETTSRISKSRDPKQMIRDAIRADRQLSAEVSLSVDKLAEELSELTDIGAALKNELVREKKELKKQLDRRREFETEVAELKLELENIQEERRKIDHDRVSVARDLDHYQNEMLFLKRQLEETEKDIVVLQDSNTAMDKTLRNTDNQTRQLDIARKTAIGKISIEKDALKEQEKEISEMRSNLDKLRSQKEDAQSKYSVLQEKLRQADQDRGLLLHSVETERFKLAALQESRMEASAEQAQLAKLMVEMEQDWAPVKRQPVGHIRSDDVYKSGVQSFSSAGASRLPRDSKGVPSGASASCLTPVYPYGRKMQGTTTSCEPSASDFRAQFSSVGYSPTTWTSFGVESAKFGSVSERRGIDRISRELGSPSEVADFLDSKELTSIGSRRAERSQFSATKRDKKQSSSVDSSEPKPRKTGTVRSPSKKKKRTPKKESKQTADEESGGSTATFGY